MDQKAVFEHYCREFLSTVCTWAGQQMALVLVVDDEALVRMNAVDMIEHAGQAMVLFR